MTRTLPWLKGVSATTTSTKRAKAPTAADEPAKKLRRRSPSISSSRGSSPWRTVPRTPTKSTTTATINTPESRSHALTTHARNRTPSTSPPPPLPSFSPMRPSSRGGHGLDAAWIMVEDEFLSTAQAFTQHLHHAEYKRLLALAQQKPEAGVDSIVRPVDWRVPRSKELELKLRARMMASKGALGNGVAEEDQEEEEIIISNKHLAGLILRNGGSGDSEGARRRVIDLTDGIRDRKIKSKTRAAAGFGKQETAAVKTTYDLPGFQRRQTPAVSARQVSVTTTNNNNVDETSDSDLDNALIPTSAIKAQVSRYAPPAPPTASRLPSLTELRSLKDTRQPSVAPPLRLPSASVAPEPRLRLALQNHQGPSATGGINLGSSILSRSKSRFSTPTPTTSHISTYKPSSVLGNTVTVTKTKAANPPTHIKSEPCPAPFIDELMPKPRSAALLTLQRAKADGATQSRGLGRFKKEEDTAKRHSVKLEEIPTFLF